MAANVTRKSSKKQKEAKTAAKAGANKSRAGANRIKEIFSEGTEKVRKSIHDNSSMMKKIAGPAAVLTAVAVGGSVAAMRNRKRKNGSHK